MATPLCHITEIQVKVLPDPAGKTMAFARVTIADALVLNDIKIVEGVNGLFVSMPQRYDEPSKQYYDYYNPITKPAREELHNFVLDAYEAEVLESTRLAAEAANVAAAAAAEAAKRQTPPARRQGPAQRGR